MPAVALALAVLVGVSLGLLGGGGAILTLPILTLVVGMETKAAIAGSLVVVGATSIAGLVAHARAGRVAWRTGALFGTAGMLGAFAGGRAAAAVPAPVLLALFGAMMAAAAIAMLRRPRVLACAREVPAARVLVQGALVGAATGLVGAGGGFVVVPALVVLGGLAMERAIGTSLLVIAMQSCAGLLGHLGHAQPDWPIVGAMAALAIAGSFAGSALAGRVPAQTLRRAFGVLVIAMAIVVGASALCAV